MSKELEELRKKYEGMTDEELINIAYIQSFDYTDEAVELAKKLLRERQIKKPSDEIIKELKNKILNDRKEKEEFKGDVLYTKRLDKAIKRKDYYFLGGL